MSAKRAKTIGVSTVAWRERARAAFDARGRGAQAECSRDIRHSEAAISRVLAGETASSEVVTKISEWLKIEQPSRELTDPALVALLDAAQALDTHELRALVQMAESLARKR